MPIRALLLAVLITVMLVMPAQATSKTTSTTKPPVTRAGTFAGQSTVPSRAMGMLPQESQPALMGGAPAPDPATTCQPQLYVSAATGTTQVSLTTTPMRVSFPRWSPNSQKILFLADPSGSYSNDIYTIGADGTGLVQRTFTGDVATAAWGSDGIIVYTRSGLIDAGIYRMEESGANQQLIYGTTQVYHLDYHPLAGVIFVNTANNQLYRINLDGTNLVQMTNTEAIREPRFNRAGTKIAIVSGSNPATTRIVTMNADGSDRWPRTNGAVAVYSPSWSADGSKLTYMELTYNGAPQSRTLPANADLATASTHLVFGDHPEFSPDAQKLLFTDYVCPQRQTDWYSGTSYAAGGWMQTRGFGFGASWTITSTVVGPGSHLAYTNGVSLTLDTWQPDGGTGPDWSGMPLPLGDYSARYFVQTPDATQIKVDLASTGDAWGADSGPFPAIRNTFYVEGIVLDYTGLPLENAAVGIEGRDGLFKMAVTDAQGRYKIRWLPRGDYTVTPQYNQRTFESQHVVIDDYMAWPADLSDIDFRATSGPAYDYLQVTIPKPVVGSNVETQLETAFEVTVAANLPATITARLKDSSGVVLASNSFAVPGSGLFCAWAPDGKPMYDGSCHVLQDNVWSGLEQSGEGYKLEVEANSMGSLLTSTVAADFTIGPVIPHIGFPLLEQRVREASVISATIVLTRSHDTDSAFTSTVSIGGMATMGLDYLVVPVGNAAIVHTGDNSIAWFPGEIRKVWIIYILNDEVVEGTESIVWILKYDAQIPISIIGNGRHTISLEDDEVQPEEGHQYYTLLPLVIRP